jgi:hypothetical protein
MTSTLSLMQERILNTKHLLQQSTNWRAKYQKNGCIRGKIRGRLPPGGWSDMADDPLSGTP